MVYHCPSSVTHSSDGVKQAKALAEVRKAHEILQYEDSGLNAKKKQLESDV